MIRSGDDSETLNIANTFVGSGWLDHAEGDVCGELRVGAEELGPVHRVDTGHCEGEGEAGIFFDDSLFTPCRDGSSGLLVGSSQTQTKEALDDSRVDPKAALEMDITEDILVAADKDIYEWGHAEAGLLVMIQSPSARLRPAHHTSGHSPMQQPRHCSGLSCGDWERTDRGRDHESKEEATCPSFLKFSWNLMKVESFVLLIKIKADTT